MVKRSFTGPLRIKSGHLGHISASQESRERVKKLWSVITNWPLSRLTSAEPSSSPQQVDHKKLVDCDYAPEDIDVFRD